MSGRRQWQASDLVDQLAQRHAKDVFVSECKDGSSWEGARRLDAWALAKSWSPWRTYGYEIKVSRSDFEQDQKWLEYLPCCHHFSFVCPAGLIRATDLSDGVGLIWMSPSGSLVTKVKAARREPDPKRLLALMSYVLMSRCRVVGDMHQANGSQPADDETPLERLARLEDHVRTAEKRKELAGLVAAHVRARWHELDSRCDLAERQFEEVQRVRDHLRERGVNWESRSWGGVWQVTQQIDELIGYVETQGLVPDLRRLEERLAEMRQRLEDLGGHRTMTATDAERR